MQNRSFILLAIANFDPLFDPFLTPGSWKMTFAWEIALGIKWFWKIILRPIKNRWETNLSKIIQKILVLGLSIYVDVKRFLDSPLHAINETYKSSKLIISNVFKYEMARFLQFWCKLNTRRIVKTCPLRFLRDYYGGSLDVMFSSFLTIS